MIGQLNEIGEVRHINVLLPFTIGLLDNSEALVALVSPNSSSSKKPFYITLHITKPSTVKGIAEMFDVLWARSIQFDTRIHRLENRTN